MDAYYHLSHLRAMVSNGLHKQMPTRTSMPGQHTVEKLKWHRSVFPSFIHANNLNYKILRIDFSSR